MFRIDFDGEGKIFLICFLDHARYPNKVDLIRHWIPAHNGGSRQDEDVDINVPQMRGDSHGTAYMSEAIGVMGVHEDVIIRFDSSAHFLKLKGISLHLNRRFGTGRRDPLFPLEKMMIPLHPVGILGQ